jgi:ATP-dependent Lon protease
VKDIILPEDNRQNVQEDLTPAQLQGLNLHYVKSFPEVLEIALPATAAEEKRDEEVREQVLTGVHSG